MRALIAVLASFVAATAVADDARIWNFTVSLDGKPIGYHRYELTRVGDTEEVSSDAKFDVKVLFVNAFRYRHTNRETWNGNCLDGFSAATEVNRKKLNVSGNRDGQEFIVDDGSGPVALGECIMTFAYWNSDFLQEPRLLNPQSGEYLDVEVTPMPRAVIDVRGKQVTASPYRVKAEEMALTVWYSDDDEWLALESVARGGRILRYDLT